MLERVSAALAKFLNPLTSSIRNSLDSDGGVKQEFQKFKKESQSSNPSTEIKKSTPHLTLVPPLQPKALESLEKGAGLGTTITEIMSFFKDHRSLVRRWGGSKAYRTSLKSKSMSLRKGTIFDETVE